MRSTILYIAMLICGGLWSQKPGLNPDLMPSALVVEHKLVWGGNQSAAVRVPSDITSYVSRRMAYGSDVELRMAYQRSSQTLDHYHFYIFFKGYRIHGGEVHAAVLPDGQVKLIQVPRNGFSVISGSSDPDADARLAQAALGAQVINSAEPVLVPDGDGWKLVSAIELSGPETLHREVLVSEGEIIYNNDLLKHFGLAGPGDTVVDVRVFDPDPLTTAQQTYGGKYTDNNDQNSGNLNTERQLRSTIFTFENGLFKPENDYVRITEFSAPITAQTARSSPDFNFTRDKDQFEDVNVVYHITHLRQHIIDLGYPSLPSYQVEVDAHALSGSDQSFFSTSVFPYRLYFGEGGVDDAEDADVILHEFTHAVITEAAPTGSKDVERKCIEEALCDYFAASYSREVSLFRANEVFNWDGHNEFWPGRSVSTNKDYNQASFSNGNYYADTDIMASSLNEVMRRLGRDATDQLVLESLFFLTSSTRMPAFGKFMLISDTLLNGAGNIRTISESFYNRGILSKIIEVEEFDSNSGNIRIMATNRFAEGGEMIVQASKGLSEISIYSINGTEVLKLVLSGSEEQKIGGDGFDPGFYIIKVADKSGAVYTQKLLRH